MSTPESVEKNRRAEGMMQSIKHLFDLVRAHPDKAPPEAVALLHDTVNQIRAKDNDQRANRPS